MCVCVTAPMVAVKISKTGSVVEIIYTYNNDDGAYLCGCSW